jgi:hypothetical protein
MSLASIRRLSASAEALAACAVGARSAADAELAASDARLAADEAELRARDLPGSLDLPRALARADTAAREAAQAARVHQLRALRTRRAQMAAPLRALRAELPGIDRALAVDDQAARAWSAIEEALDLLLYRLTAARGPECREETP